MSRGAKSLSRVRWAYMEYRVCRGVSKGKELLFRRPRDQDRMAYLGKSWVPAFTETHLHRADDVQVLCSEDICKSHRTYSRQ